MLYINDDFQPELNKGVLKHLFFMAIFSVLDLFCSQKFTIINVNYDSKDNTSFFSDPTVK